MSRFPVLDFGKTVLKSYGAALFSDRYVASVLFLIATFYDPTVGLLGLLGNTIANGVAVVLRTDKNYLRAHVFGINGILVGICVGLYTELSVESFAILVIGSALATIISLSLLSILTRRRHLPILSIPFVLTSWTILLALKAIHQETVHSALTPMWLTSVPDQFLTQLFPHWLNSLLITFGSTLFQSTVLSGVLIVLGIVYTSRVSFAFGVFGGIVGLLVYRWVGGDVDGSQTIPFGLNYIIIAIALGGFFVAPNLQGALYAILGVAAGVLVISGLQSALQPFGIPVLVAPFNLVVLMFLYPLQSQILYHEHAGLVAIPLTRVSTPEINRRWYVQHHGKRMTVRYRLPFYGMWSVMQGEFGHHTHKGTQAYAFDFTVIDHNGKPFRGVGLQLEEFFAFGLPVLAPADGKVVAVVNHVKDNLPGEVNETENWGNYIVIQHAQAEYTEMSHFKQGSILVNVGDSVRCGQVIGLCGNSGYSAVPHIHIQRQKGAFLAAETIPLKFSNILIQHNGITKRHELATLPQGGNVGNAESESVDGQPHSTSNA